MGLGNLNEEQAESNVVLCDLKGPIGPGPALLRDSSQIARSDVELPCRFSPASITGSHRSVAYASVILQLGWSGLFRQRVGELKVDLILWRPGQIRPYFPKARKPLALPLTNEVEAALTPD